MTSVIQLVVFEGAGSEDPKQFWFMVMVVGEVHGVMDDNIRKATLVSTL